MIGPLVKASTAEQVGSPRVDAERAGALHHQGHGKEHRHGDGDHPVDVCVEKFA
jgi:hypothetical protein